jgi:hypothetical protein
VYAPDVSGIANADDSGDVEVDVSAARRPWAWCGEVDASLLEM